MRRVRSVQAALVATGTLIALLAGCSAESPTTTYLDSAGRSTTVDWADFPAYSGTDTGLVLAGPSVEETEERATHIFAAIRLELDREFSTTGWTEQGEAGWFPADGNGYGGQSMLSLYNSGTWESSTPIPSDQWTSVISRVGSIAAEWGLSDPGHPGDDGDSGWMRSNSFFRGVEWLDVSVQDARLEEEALKDAEELGWLVHGVTLSYGITTVHEDDRGEFARRSAPFIGLDHPEPTASD